MDFFDRLGPLLKAAGFGLIKILFRYAKDTFLDSTKGAALIAAPPLLPVM